MALSPEEVRHISSLCRLSMTQAEIDDMTEQLSYILEQFDELRSVDTENMEPTLHAAGLQSVWREDETSVSLPVEEVLANAPREQAEQFRVRIVLDE